MHAYNSIGHGNAGVHATFDVAGKLSPPALTSVCGSVMVHPCESLGSSGPVAQMASVLC